MKRYTSPFVFGTLQTLTTTLKDENMKILVFGTLWTFSVQLLNEDTCTRNENFFLYFNHQNCFARKSKKSNLLVCMAWKDCSNRNINNQTKKQKLHPKQKLEIKLRIKRTKYIGTDLVIHFFFLVKILGRYF